MLIAICNNNTLQLNYISSLVKDYFQNTPSVSVSPYSPETFSDYIVRKGCPFDILLLDIEMGEYDGITLAKEINKLNSLCQIIFMNGNFKSYFRIYETNHIYFLIKSQLKELLPKALTKAVYNLENTKTDFLSIKHKGKTIILLQKNILYLESVGRHILIHVKENTYECIRPLCDLNNELLDYFVRCHNSYIINFMHLHDFTRTEATLNCGIHIPISRTYYKNFKIGYSHYLNQLNGL